MKKIQSLLLIALLTFFGNSFAISLQNAKSDGLVGETPSGYLAIATKPSTDELKALVLDINSKRKAKYQEIATKVGKTLTSIEKMAGNKAISKTKAGHLVQKPDGSWAKK